MNILLDGCLAFFCAVGMATTLWWLACALFDRPTPPTPEDNEGDEHTHGHTLHL